MRLTKHAHACVEILQDDTRILIDPGTLTPDARELLTTADEVLITHEHPDHFDATALADAISARPELRVHAPHAVVNAWSDPGLGVVPVGVGDAFAIGSVTVTVHGGVHAEIHPDVPRPENVGYLVGGRVYHPGDSLVAPGVAVEVLLVPASGPWFRTAGAVDLIRDMEPGRVIAIHDAHASVTGLESTARLIERLTGRELEVLEPGSSVEL